jgi:nitrogenase molybdenum-iron protein alpha/beta subunit
MSLMMAERPPITWSAKMETDRCRDPYLRCAFYGAAQTLLGVRDSCLLAHSPQGCQLLVDRAFGWQQADYTQTKVLCTKLCEAEIVHGGEDLLARTIYEGTAYEVPVMFILSACGPEIVGDDIVGVCRRLQDGVPFRLVPVPCPGFRGSQYLGVDVALDILIDHFAQEGHPQVERSVCLIAPHANANPTWQGDLAWVRGVLERMGATVVAVLAHDTAFSELGRMASAQYSLVLSHDAGQKAADRLAADYGIQPLCAGLPLPLGLSNTAAWLTGLGEVLGAEDAAEEMIRAGETRVVEQLRRRGVEIHFFSKAEAAIVADASVGIPLLRLLFEDLEMVPRLICLRASEAEARALLTSECQRMGCSPMVVPEADVYQVKEALREVPVDAVFGSDLESHLAHELGIPFGFQIVNPMTRFRMTDREYMGYTGLLNLVETVQNDWWDRQKSKRRRYEGSW